MVKKVRKDVVASQGGVPAETPEMVQALLNEAKARKIQVLDGIRNYRDTHYLETFVPHEKQQLFFDALRDPTLRTFLLLSGNRFGKTTASISAGVSLAQGRFPWVPVPKVTNRSAPISIRVSSPERVTAKFADGEFTFETPKIYKAWQSSQLSPPDAGLLRWKPPIKIRILAEDMTALDQVTIPKFRQFCAPEWVIAKKKNSFGLEVHWIFANGSVVDFMTYQQDVSTFEGWDGHVVIYDEPPPRSHYIANLRGLVDHSGLSIFSMTPISQAWVHDELVSKADNSIWSLTATTRDNPHLKASDIVAFESALSEDEKKSRILGEFKHLSGLIFKDFKPSVHIVSCREAPKDSTVYVAIDTHPRTEQAVVFMWVDKRGNMFICHEMFQHATPEKVAEWIIDYHDDHHKVELALIDPSSQGDRNRGETTYDVIANKLSDKGIPLDFGSKDLSSGIQLMQEAFKSRNGLASLFIDPSCKRFVWELNRYIWDNWKSAGADQKECNRPIDKDDHLIENVRRLVQLPAEYRSPRSVADLQRQNRWRASDDLAGY